MKRQPCRFLGSLHQKGSHHPDVFVCHGGMKVCSLLPSDAITKEGPLASCELSDGRTCANYSAGKYVEHPRSVGKCSYRSAEPIRHDVNNLCGARGEDVAIFACSHPDLMQNGNPIECSLYTYCRNQVPRICLTCDKLELEE